MLTVFFHLLAALALRLARLLGDGFLNGLLRGDLRLATLGATILLTSTTFRSTTNDAHVMCIQMTTKNIHKLNIKLITLVDVL